MLKKVDVEHRVRKKSVTRSHTRVTQCLYPECAHALVLDARLSLVMRKVDGASLYVRGIVTTHATATVCEFVEFL